MTLYRLAKRFFRFWRPILTGKFQAGSCPTCGHRTVYVENGADLREGFVCYRCLSLPRWRGLIAALESHFPDWRERTIYECSPAGAASNKLAAECPQYVASHYYPERELGSMVDGFRCEDLSQLTFEDHSFDIVITQDVLEHVFDPEKVFSEIARVLKPGGAHIFTVPYVEGANSVVRAHKTEDAQVEYLHEKVFHGSPNSADGSLVVTDWGLDIVDFVHQHSGLLTHVISNWDPRVGVRGRSPGVFLDSKTHRVKRA